MARVIGAVLGLLTVVLIPFVLIWALQRKLMYFPVADVPAPHEVGLHGVTAVTFPTSDGLLLNGWFITPEREPAWATVIIFNGNAGHRAFRAPLAGALAREGIAVLLFDYRGYGENPGVPTEHGLIIDSRAARQYVLGRPDVDPNSIAYFGESLGTAVAASLAADHPPMALILRSPFTSMTDIGRLHYPFLPVQWLLRDRFATLEPVAGIRCPLLVIAGDRDRIIPLEQSKQIYEVVSTAKTLHIVSGADHNDYELLAGKGMIDAIVRFLRAHSGAPFTAGM